MTVVENLFKKMLIVNNSFIEKTYVVGTHWDCLIVFSHLQENQLRYC